MKEEPKADLKGPVSVSLPGSMVRILDKKRGRVPRSAFILEILERELKIPILADADDEDDSRLGAEIAKAKEQLARNKAKLQAVVTALEDASRKKASLNDPLEAAKIDVLERGLLDEQTALTSQVSYEKGIVQQEQGFLTKQRRKSLVKSFFQEISDGKQLLPDCERCGLNDKVELAEGIVQPVFLKTCNRQQGWTDPTRPMVLDLACHRCGIRFNAELEEKSSNLTPKRSINKRRQSLTDGYMPSVY